MKASKVELVELTIKKIVYLLGQVQDLLEEILSTIKTPDGD